MIKQKVTILTGISQTSGNEILKKLVKSNRKVIVLGDISENFYFNTKDTSSFKLTTELPVTAATFQTNDVQFSFGDMSDISFLAAVFTQARKNGLEIELVCHLSDEGVSNFSFGDTINLLEIVKAYWQSNKETFKCFFFAANKETSTALKIEKILNTAIKKENFPAKIFIKSKDTKLTPELYRFFTPFSQPKTIKNENTSTKDINQAIDEVLTVIDED